MSHRLLIPVTPGELLDRISILRVKVRNLSDRAKLSTVTQELSEMTDIWDNSPYSVRMSAEVGRCINGLLDANQAIWDAENEIRINGSVLGFATRAALDARDANDKRTDLKRRINDELDVFTTEVKDYAEARRDAQGQGS
jgi:hypothetical protein